MMSTPSRNSSALSVAPEKRTLYVRENDGTEYAVSWYGDVPSDDIRKTICYTLGLDHNTDFVLEDDEKHSIVVSSSLPSGLHMNICY